MGHLRKEPMGILSNARNAVQIHYVPRTADGKPVEDVYNTDTLGLMQQLDVVPAMKPDGHHPRRRPQRHSGLYLDRGRTAGGDRPGDQ